MPLNAGDPQATAGLARDIYQALDGQLRPQLEEQLGEPIGEDLEKAWRDLSFSIATGVIEHFLRVPPTEPEFAETFTSATQDAPYWAWLRGFEKVFRDWAAGAGQVADLRNALTTFFNANPTPTQLRGVLR